jgi:CRISPR-associated protein Cmr5
MKNSRAEALTSIALDLLEAGSQGISHNNSVPKEFSGYISSFAQTIAQSGASRSVRSFADKTADTAQKRHLLIELVCDVLKQGGFIKKADYVTLQDFVDRAGSDVAETKALLLDAAEACKRALRTFKRI